MNITSDFLERVNHNLNIMNKMNKDIEVIIIYHNDFPTEKELNLDFTFIQTKQLNAANSRNHAIAFTHSENLVFFDNDSLMTQKIAEDLTRFSRQEVIEATFYESRKEKNPPFPLSLKSIPPIYFADTGLCVVKRIVFDRGLRFDEKISRGEDADFATKLVRYKFLVHFSTLKFDEDSSETKWEKQIKRWLTVPYYQTLVKRFVQGKDTQDKYRSYLNLMINDNHKADQLIDDFFIYDNVLFYWKKNKFNNSKYFKIFLKNKNIKIFQILES